MALPIQLAEYAVSNPDGTYTIIRGGISNWKSATLPLTIKLTAFIEIPPGSLPAGEHILVLEVRAASKMLATGHSQIALSAPDKVTYLALNVEAIADQYGPVTLKIRVGDLPAQATLDLMPL